MTVSDGQRSVISFNFIFLKKLLRDSIVPHFVFISMDGRKNITSAQFLCNIYQILLETEVLPGVYLNFTIFSKNRALAVGA